MVAIVHVIDPYEKNQGILVPFLTQRVLDTATTRLAEADPAAFTRFVFSRVYTRDPALRLTAFVEGDAIVGHAIASVEFDGVKPWIYVSQLTFDPINVGDAKERYINEVDAWAMALKVPVMLLAAPRKDEALVKKYGFSVARVILARQVGATGV